MHNNAISVNSMHRIRAAQDLALYNLTLTEEIDGLRRHRAPGDLEHRPGLAGRPGGRRAADRDRRLVRGDLRRERGVRAAGRRAVPQPAGAASGAAQRRLRHPDRGRRGGVRLRRARPALHDGDVRAAHHRPRVRRPQQGDHAGLAVGLGAAVPSPPPARCSRCGRSPMRSRRGSRTAWTRRRAGSAASWPTCTWKHRRSWPSDHVQDSREPVQVRQHRVQHVRLHPDEQPGRRGRRRGHEHQAQRDA